MRIVIASRDGDFARIFGYDDAGNETFQVTRNITDDLKDAAKSKKSLEEVVAKKLGGAHEAKARQATEVRVVTLDTAAPHEHIEYLKFMPEHEHDHAIGTELQLLDAIKRIEDFAIKVQESLRGHGHEAIPHEHTEVLPHEHPPHSHTDILGTVTEMQSLIGDLASSVAKLDKAHSHDNILAALREAEASIASVQSGLSSHAHPHEHTALANEVGRLVTVQGEETRQRESEHKALSGKLDKHTHPAEKHEHPHAHDDIAKILIALEERLGALALTVANAGDSHSHSDVQESFRQVRSEIAATDARFSGHSHAHDHNDLSEMIARVRTDASGHEHPIPDHKHDHTHDPVWHDHEQYEAQVKALQAQLSDLNGRLVAVTQEWRVLLDAQAEAFRAALKELAGAKHGHDEYAVRVDFEKHIQDVSKKTDLRVLSEENTAGRRRLIVEEAK